MLALLALILWQGSGGPVVVVETSTLRGTISVAQRLTGRVTVQPG